MGKISVAQLGGAERELGVIVLARNVKNSYTADEVSDGLQLHMSISGGTYGGDDCYHDLALLNAAGTSIGLVRYGPSTSVSSGEVWECNFADTSKFRLEKTDYGAALTFYLWTKKAADGTRDIYDSTGAELLLSGVSRFSYTMFNNANVQSVFISFLKEA